MLSMSENESKSSSHFVDEFKKRDELDENDLDIDNIMLVCCSWMRHSQNIVNDIMDLIVKYAAFKV